MKKFYFILFLLITLAFLAGFFWHGQTQKLREVEFDIESLSYGGDNDNYKIESKYPVLKNGISKKATDKINAEVKKFVSDSVIETKDEFDAFVHDIDVTGSSAKPQFLNEFTIKSDFNKLPFINIIFETYYYAGGAHGITVVLPLVFDVQTGNKLLLHDVFIGEYLKLLSNLSLEILKEKDPENNLYSFADEGTLPEADNFKFFALEEDGVHIFFQDYQVGPYVIGHPEIVIPYEKLNGVLRPEFKDLINDLNKK